MKPWAKSTGPKSPEGKAAVSRDAFTGGELAKLRELSKMVNAEIRQARELVSADSGILQKSGQYWSGENFRE